MAGLAKVFGAGAMTNSMAEIEECDCMFVIGSNTKENHPIVALRMIKAVRRGAKLIIADPRKVPLVKHAHLWIQQRPGTDVALLNSMMHVIVKEDLINKEYIEKHTEGFEDVIKNLEEFTPEYGEKITGVPKEKIIEAARMYAGSEKSAIFYTMGITQHSHGTDNVYSIANLALLTGHIGRRSTGVNPLRGQNNVQGSSDMGGSPDKFHGYQSVEDEAIREKFEKAWKTKLPAKKGMTAVDMTDAAIAEKIKAMYIMGENPVISDPDVKHTKESLENLDFLIVQDIFLSETAEMADVVFPAASSFEKNGTFTNTERRVQRVRKVVQPPGEAKEDSWIIKELSKRVGYDVSFDSIDEVFDEIISLWPKMAGINYKRIDEVGIQWPCTDLDHTGTCYLYEDGFPIGKGKFSVVKYRESAELPDNEFPFILTTGRQLFQYHTGTMTRRVKAINKVSPGPYVEINPVDADDIGINPGDLLKITSRRGSISVKADVTNKPGKGVVFVPFHFREAAANTLTNTVYDPICKIPELKVCAVRVEKE